MAPSKNTEVINDDRCGHNTEGEDIEWLASLAEHELDFLISLKDLVTLRAKNIGHKDLTQKFDIKVLRALAFVLLEYFKDRIRNTPDVPVNNILGSLSGCRLLDFNSDSTPDTVTVGCNSSTKNVNFLSSRRKRMWDGLQEDTSSNKKQRTTNGTYFRRH